MFIYPYKSGSRSARELGQRLGAKRIKLRGSKFNPSPNKTIINWGSSSMPESYLRCNVLNKPDAVALCANKRTFFNYLSNSDVRTPEIARSKAEVLEKNRDLNPDKVTWVARHRLTANSGRGIELIKGSQEDFGECRLYVRYVPKSQEYRVHVFQGEVVDVQRKAKSRSVPDEEVNWHIRNHGNGFIFARNEEHTPPDDVLLQAQRATNLVGLDFGAADVVWHEGRGEAYVLEINTAPGVTGSTLEGYAGRFEALR